MHYYQYASIRIHYFVFGAFLTLGMIAGILNTSWTTVPQNAFLGTASLIIPFLCGGVWLVTTSLRFRLTLTPHALTLRRAYTTRTIERSDIESFKEVYDRNYGSVLWVQSRRRKRSSIVIPCVFKEKDAVMAWFQGIPALAAGMTWLQRHAAASPITCHGSGDDEVLPASCLAN